MTTRRQLAGCLAVVALSFVGAGCSVSVGGSDSNGLSAEQLQSKLSDEAAAKTGDPIDSIQCTSGVDAEVGDATTCKVTEKGVVATWDVKVTEVDDGNDTINFSWTVQDGSQRLLADSIVGSIGDSFAQQTGYTLSAVECPQQEIAAQPGTSVTCQVTTAEGQTGPLRLYMKGADGMTVNYSWDLPAGES